MTHRLPHPSRSRSPLARAVTIAAVTALALGAELPTAWLGPAEAQAQQRDMQKAQKYFQRGKQLYNNQKYLEAADAFKKAYKFSGKGELLYNIGQSYRKADQLGQAEEFFQEYLNKKPNASNADKVVNLVIQIQQELAARMATVKIRTAAEGRNVFVGGESEPRCQSPCSLSLEPGVHKVRVEAQGFDSFEKSVGVSRSETKTLEVKLKEDISPGRLAVNTGQRGGSLSVAGVGEYSLPMEEPVEVKPGSYDVNVTGENGQKWSGKVEVAEGETARVFVPLEASAGGGGGMNVRRSVAVGLGGASLALFAGGIVMGLQASDTHQTLSQTQRDIGSVNGDLVRKGKAQQQAANILLGAGGVTLAGGAGLLTWDLLAGGGSDGSPKEAGLKGRIGLTGASVGTTLQW